MQSKIALTCLSALAHGGRIDLFRRLVRAGPEGMAAGDIANSAGVNFTTASAQLSVLANAGLVTNERQGRSIRYAANYEQVRSLMAYLMEDCCQGRREILAPLAEITNRTARCEPSEGASS